MEWYDFLREAERRYPDVQFVVLGRLQEKPLELLRLPNVMSLRTLGWAWPRTDAYAALPTCSSARPAALPPWRIFRRTPYFITKMSRESCNAYEIEFGCDRLPFATERQRLIYQPETKDLLLGLLEQGLNGVPPRGPGRNPSARSGDRRARLGVGACAVAAPWRHQRALFPR
jgi:hypothetical protein